MNKQKLIILDRDGVINHDSADYVKTPDEWRAIPDSLEAIARLHTAGYSIAIATNQAGIGRGLYTHEILADIHAKLIQQVEAAGGKIKTIKYCPHAPDAGCRCRKPETGMLEDIADEFNLASLIGVPFIGDTMKDINAGLSMGCQSILVKTGYGEQTLADNPTLQVPIYDNLAAVVASLLVN